MMIIIGIDWARSKHDLVFMKEDGEMLKHMVISHALDGFMKINEEVEKLGLDPSEVKVGIEHNKGALLSFLLSSKYQVYAFNPKSAHSARDRFRPSGSKDDKSDAYIIADMVRTDPGLFRPMEERDDLILKLRQFLSYRSKLVHEKTRKINQLCAILAEWCPGIEVLCRGYESQWHRKFLQVWPLHQDFRDASKEEVEKFFKGRGVRKKNLLSVWELWNTDSIKVPNALVDTLRMEIRDLSEDIDLLHKKVKTIEEKLETIIETHPDSEVFKSLPIKGNIMIAGLMVMLGTNKETCPKAKDLSAIVGAAPITVASGKLKKVRRRQACDKLLLEIIMMFSYLSLQTSGWAREYYDSKKSAGKSHYSALRSLSMKWVKIIYSIWINNSAYDENKHQEKRLISKAA